MPVTPSRLAAVVALQSLVGAVPDGRVGPQTRAAAAAYDAAAAARTTQEHLVRHWDAPLVVDGVWGPRSTHAWRALLALLARDVWGCVPGWIGGRASYYGGPDDPDDRMYDQAYLPDPVIVGGGRRATPAQYYAAVPDWVRTVLDPRMADDDAWPQTRDQHGAVARAGVSYYLTGHYCALRLSGALARAARDGRVWATIVPARGAWRVARCRVIDYGPHPRVWAAIDLSLALYHDLGLAWRGDRVLWSLEVL